MYSIESNNPEIWGPYYWFVLHSIVRTYPLHPTETAKKKYYEFIQNIPLFLPNSEIGDNFAKTMDIYPVSPYLDTRVSLMKWMHFIHNKINLKLEKEEVSFMEAVRRYDEIATMENKTSYFGKTLERFKRGTWISPNYMFTITTISIIGILTILSYYFYHKTNFISI